MKRIQVAVGVRIAQPRDQTARKADHGPKHVERILGNHGVVGVRIQREWKVSGYNGDMPPDLSRFSLTYDTCPMTDHAHPSLTPPQRPDYDL